MTRTAIFNFCVECEHFKNINIDFENKKIRCNPKYNFRHEENSEQQEINKRIFEITEVSRKIFIINKVN